MSDLYELYADGSSTGKVGEGGWAFVVLKNKEVIKEDSNGALSTTNNKMELMGVIEGLEYLYTNNLSLASITVFSDSQYVVKGITEWYAGWEVKIARGKTILNQEYWLRFKQLSENFPHVKYQWINGHSGIEYNERCDVLAKAAKKKITEESLNESNN